MVLDPAKRKAMAIRFLAGPLLILAVVLLILSDCHFDGGQGRVSAAFIGILAVAGIWEYCRMLTGSGRPVATLWLLLATALLHGSVFFQPHEWSHLDGELALPACLLGGLLVPLLALALTPKGMAQGLERAGATLLGFILLAMPLYLAQGLCLRCLYWMVWVAIVAKGGDIGAYLIGSFFGKRKLIPHVSPGKSWEGAFGGLAFSLILGGAFSFLIPEAEMKLSFFGWMALGIMVGLTAQISDLMESLIKRLCQVKDSSRLLPVHGGVLDLTDSFMLSVPILFFVVMLIGGKGSGV